MNIDDKIPRHVVAKLFFGAYLSPFVLGAALALILGGGNAGCIIYFVPYMLILFPAGLPALVDTSRSLAPLGYLMYALVFVLALKFRQPWQTSYLFGLFLILIVFNILGCRELANHVTDGMTLP